MDIISADSHVQEPRELYSERIAKRYRDRAPRIVERDAAADQRKIVHDNAAELYGFG